MCAKYVCILSTAKQSIQRRIKTIGRNLGTCIEYTHRSSIFMVRCCLSYQANECDVAIGKSVSALYSRAAKSKTTDPTQIRAHTTIAHTHTHSMWWQSKATYTHVSTKYERSKWKTIIRIDLSIADLLLLSLQRPKTIDICGVRVSASINCAKVFYKYVYGYRRCSKHVCSLNCRHLLSRKIIAFDLFCYIEQIQWNCLQISLMDMLF